MTPTSRGSGGDGKDATFPGQNLLEDGTSPERPHSRSQHGSILESLGATFVAHPEGMGSMLMLTEGTSLRGTMFNLCNTMLGAGILSLPYAADHAGMVTAVIMLVVVAILQDLSAWMLLVAVDSTKEISFAVVAEVLYNRCLGILVDTMVCLNNFGVLMSYVVILGDLFPSFMSSVGAPAFLTNRTTLVLICFLALLWPLSSLRKLGLLRFASLITLMVIGALAVILVCMGTGVIDIAHSASSPRAPMFNSDAKSVFSQVPFMIFAYNCNMNVPILYGELRRQHRESVDSRFGSKRGKMMISMHCSLFICCVFYCLASIEGCLAFRDATETNVLNNFNSSEWRLSPYLKVSYAIALSCSFPVMAFSCVTSFHRLLWHVQNALPCRCCLSEAWSPRPARAPELESPPEQNAMPNTPSHEAPYPLEMGASPPESSCAVHQLEVVTMVGSAVALGLAFPNLGAVFTLTGGVCGSFLSYIFPGLFFYKVASTSGGRMVGISMFALGVVICISTPILQAIS